ncbi:MAG: response regulator transcription factor [Dehalococcoidia bacterium]
MPDARRILVVEDEDMVADVVERYLRRDGYEVEVAHDGNAGLAAYRRAAPDLVVLDVMLPGIDGLEVCQRIREDGATPVILLTARDGEADKINGLGLGADDYVTKPFSPRELVARVEAVLRRAAAPVRTGGAGARGNLRFGDLEVDPVKRTVLLRGEPVALTAREFDLLAYLAEHPGRVFSREQLMDAIWDEDFEGDAGTVTVHVRRLRTKIEHDPSRPAFLRTVWGVGYKFEG